MAGVKQTATRCRLGLSKEALVPIDNNHFLEARKVLDRIFGRFVPEDYVHPEGFMSP